MRRRRSGIRHVLVHVGGNDASKPGGATIVLITIDIAQLRELAQQLRSRERMPVTCLASIQERDSGRCGG
jgi:hypothetical protein